jgi:hypothetical protein
MVDGAEAASLTVFSGYRFVRRAAARDIPIVIVNRGRTRGDGLATSPLYTVSKVYMPPWLSGLCRSSHSRQSR